MSKYGKFSLVPSDNNWLNVPGAPHSTQLVFPGRGSISDQSLLLEKLALYGVFNNNNNNNNNNKIPQAVHDLRSYVAP
jgi:hypothetical protein